MALSTRKTPTHTSKFFVMVDADSEHRQICACSRATGLSWVHYGSIKRDQVWRNQRSGWPTAVAQGWLIKQCTRVDKGESKVCGNPILGCWQKSALCHQSSMQHLRQAYWIVSAVTSTDEGTTGTEHWSLTLNFRNIPVALGQLAEVLQPNRPFGTATEGQHVTLISMIASAPSTSSSVHGWRFSGHRTISTLASVETADPLCPIASPEFSRAAIASRTSSATTTA